MKIRIKDPKDIKIESDKICIKGRKMRCGVQTEIPIEQAYMHFEDLEDKTIVVYGKNKGNAGNGAVVFDKNTMEMKSQFDRKDIGDSFLNIKLIWNIP
ncbi:MAG: hypothetical protein NT116_02560 [Candidatus Parcubacteria bacterium]|nr:hypothetical protein [Candidatus Parcubacteria bacterium]